MESHLSVAVAFTVKGKIFYIKTINQSFWAELLATEKKKWQN